MKQLRNFLSMYSVHYPAAIVFMLQSTEYQAKPYLAWYWRTYNFSTVMVRRTLDYTKAARLLLLALRSAMLVQIIIAAIFTGYGIQSSEWIYISVGAVLIILNPVIWAHLLTVPLMLGRKLISEPQEKQLVKESEAIFSAHPGVKIAVAGSYGKTTMKELLLTVLGESKIVAATPANKNVSISHAYFARKLTGEEEVLIIEYGEGAPGDVARFANITAPTHAVITGLAAAHLDRYKTVDAAGRDIFSVADYLGGKHVFVNRESPDIAPFIQPTFELFDRHAALGWKITDVYVSLGGMDFKLTKGRQSLKLTTSLVGRHQLGFLALVAALALQLGLDFEQVRAGVAKTRPFEHRMQPYELAGGWVIDDTYNGNLEGLRAGTQLLAELPAKRKIYVTPGLVDQGDQREPVHIAAGKLIAASGADLVVLMKNSVTGYIQRGLSEAGYAKEIRIEENPLEFYTNLNHFVARGDLVLMQNDWTDNYA